MKILVVEDDRAVAQALQFLFAGYNYAVDMAADGETGWQMADAYEYDLILLDVILPGLDGISLCQQLRRKRLKTPILLLTGQGDGHQKAIALNAGADDYVVKPFDTEELIARVQALLRRGNITSQPVLTWEHLSIDPSSRKVAYGSQLLSVTPKEYAILELLLRNPQSVLSARAILDHAWNSLASPGEEAVRVHIKELRQKLTAVGAPKDLIKTKYRVGYQLNPLYASALVPQPADQLTPPQIAELNAVNEELRITLEQLRSTQAEVHRKNQELETAYQTIEQERQQLQVSHDALEQLVAERTAELQLLQAERQQAEVAIRESEEHFRNMADHAPGIVWVTDPTGYCTYLSQRWCDFSGQTREAGLGFGWLEVVHPDDRDGARRIFLDANQRQEEYRLDYRLRRHDGEYCWVIDTASPWFGADGQLKGYIGSVIDISDRKQAEIALRESEAKYSTLFNSIDEGFYIIEMIFDENNKPIDYRFLEINPAFEQQTGLIDAQGKRMRELAPNHEAYWFEIYGNIAFTGESVRFENRAEQLHRWYDVYAFRVGEPERRQVAILFRDITERKQSESALYQNQQLLRLAMSGAHAGSWDWEIETGTITWSPEIYRIYGLDPADGVLNYEDWYNTILHPDDRPWVNAYVTHAMEERQPDLQLEFRIVHPQRGVRWILSLGHLTLNPEGEPMRLSGINLDISDRKQLELSLHASEAKLSRILDSAIAAICSLRLYANRDWEYEYWSAGCERLYGYSLAEFADQYFWISQVLPDDREQILMPLLDDFFAQRDTTAEYRFRRKDGSIRWFSSSYTSRKGEADYWVVTMVNHDITDRKQAELNLQQQLLREQLMADISQDIRRSLSLEHVLSRTVKRVRALLNSDRVIIFRFRSDWQGDVIMESVGAEWESFLSTTIADPCFRDGYIEPYRQGQITSIPDIHAENLEPCYVELLHQFQVRANLIVPIFQGEVLWGLLIAHQCSAPRQWQPSEIDLLRQLATTFGIAIQQSELYEQTRRELFARKQMQTVLEESEERFRTLNAAAPIAICQANADGFCLYNNARWQEMSGLSFEDSLGSGWLNAVHPDEQEGLFNAWNLYVQGNGPFFHEFRLLTPQGIIRWVATQAAAMKSVTGETIGYVSIGEDITERKQAEAALRDSEQRLRTILDNSPAAIYLLDPQNHFLFANRICAELGAKAPEELVGKSIYEFWSTEIADAFAANHQTVLETGQLLQIEETVPHPDGKLHTYITVMFPLCDEAGKPYAICGISTDITEKKQLEAQFYRAQRLESMGTLASGIAHDLNNVLTPILTIAQLLRLKQPNLDRRSLEMLQVLEDSAKRGAGMIKQIMTFTRGTGGERSPIQVAPLLQEVINVVQQTFPKSISIRQNMPNQSLSLVLADSTHLHQVFINLCVNARDAMPDGGVLSLSVEPYFVDQTFAQMNLKAQVGNYVMVTIADTGTGISPEVRDRIFEPFFTTKAPGQGTGLGLATVLGIVENYGGFLQVFSEVGRGTQIKVYLPVIEGAVTDTIELAEPLTGNGELVLIVDDDEAVQRGTQALLESYHYKTLVANDGVEAIAIYTQHQAQIKLVILDIMMPKMDGISLIQRLKKINPLVKIIAVSGLAANQTSVLATGADIFLPKPYSSETFLMHVWDLIND